MNEDSPAKACTTGECLGGAGAGELPERLQIWQPRAAAGDKPNPHSSPLPRPTSVDPAVVSVVRLLASRCALVALSLVFYYETIISYCTLNVNRRVTQGDLRS